MSSDLTQEAAATVRPTIHEAELAPGPSGAVVRGLEIDFDAALARRQSELDVVVCGDDTDANRKLAARIEKWRRPGDPSADAASACGAASTASFSSAIAFPGRPHVLRDRTAQIEKEAMRYFTRDLIERFGSSDDAVAEKAEAEWEAASERYEQHLRSIEPKLPPHIRAFNELLLHDAVVTSLARQGDKLVMVLLKDIPPRDLVTLTYVLIGEPVLQRQEGPDERGPTVMDFQHDEFDLIEEGGRQSYSQAIVFGNGWELTLQFRDVEVTLAEPLYPLPGTASTAFSGLPRSA